MQTVHVTRWRVMIYEEQLGIYLMHCLENCNTRLLFVIRLRRVRKADTHWVEECSRLYLGAYT